MKCNWNILIELPWEMSNMDDTPWLELCHISAGDPGDPGLPFSARKKRKRVHRSTWHPEGRSK